MPPYRGGCWGQPGHPNTGGAAAHPTSHPMGHRPRMCILLRADQTTGGQAPSREISLGPWVAGTHFLALSTTTWGRKMQAWISELLNSSGTARPLTNAACKAQTVPGPGLRPQGTPGTLSTPNPWGPQQPQNRHMHPKKGVTGGRPPPPAASRYGQTPGREPRVQASGLGTCGRPVSGRLLSLHLEKENGKGTRPRTPLTGGETEVRRDRTDIPSAIAAGLARTPDRHGLPLPLRGSTPAPMVRSGRLGAPVGRSGGGVSARSSRPSCENVLLHADASLSTVLCCGLRSSHGVGAVLPPGNAGRHLETPVVSAGCPGLCAPQDGPAAEDGQPRAPSAPGPGTALPRSCPLGSPAVLAVATGWSRRSV
uniref:Proline rich 25 n=1 Tax=Nomascus leucogenys TaxID=61853 RepID=A0A2I3HYM0_NOMLE